MTPDTRARREVMDEVQYLGGGFVFLIGANSWILGLSFERGTYVMVWVLDSRCWPICACG
jgi:hypothetical protein